MGYTMKAEGLTELSTMLNRMGNQAERVASAGLYEGAAEMVAEVKSKVSQIKTERFHYTVFGQRKPSPEEKDALQAIEAGIAKFDKNGSEVNTSVGYSGAGYVLTGYGKVKPVAQIANAINSGTSFMQKQPFFRRAVSSGTKKAERAIKDVIEANYQALIDYNNGGKTE